MRTSTKVGAGIVAAVLVFLGLFAANDSESFKGALRFPIGPFKANTLTASVNHDVAGDKVTRGTSSVRIGSWKLRVFGENVDLTSLTFSTKAAGAAYMTNLTAKVNGANFGTVAPVFQTLVAASPNGAYTGKHLFTLPANGLLRLNQTSHTVDLYADIGTGYQPVPDSFPVEFWANGKSIRPVPNLARPQPIKPLKNFMSNVARGQTTDVFEHGEILVSKASDSPSGDVLPGNDITLAKWNLQAAYENAEVRGFCFTILNSPNQIVTGPAGNIALTGTVQFVLDNGQVVHSMAAAYLQWETCVDLSSYFLLQKNVPETLSVKANISDSARGTLMARLWRVQGVGQNSASELESVGNSFGNTLTLPQQAPITPPLTPPVLAVTYVGAEPSFFNPSNGQTTDFAFTLNLEATATLVVKRASDGSTVRTLLSNQFFTADRHNYIWSGRDNNSAIVPPGLYTFEVTATTPQFGGQTSTGIAYVTVTTTPLPPPPPPPPGSVPYGILEILPSSQTPTTVLPGDVVTLGIWQLRAVGEGLEVGKLCFDMGGTVSLTDFENFRVDEYVAGASTAGVIYSSQALGEHIDGTCNNQQYAISPKLRLPVNTPWLVAVRAKLLPSALGKIIRPQLGNAEFTGVANGHTATIGSSVPLNAVTVGN